MNNKNIKGDMCRYNIRYIRSKKTLFEYLKQLGVRTIKRCCYPQDMWGNYSREEKSLDEALKDTNHNWDNFWVEGRLSVERKNRQTYIVTFW